jgi:hypothetical protein
VIKGTCKQRYLLTAHVPAILPLEYGPARNCEAFVFVADFWPFRGIRALTRSTDENGERFLLGELAIARANDFQIRMFSDRFLIG